MVAGTVRRHLDPTEFAMAVQLLVLCVVMFIMFHYVQEIGIPV